MGEDESEELMKFLPDGQEDAAKIVLENGKFFQIWKEKANGDEYHYQTDIGLPCLSFPTKGDCSTIEVILDGDVKKFYFLVGKYKKTNVLYNGKCVWARYQGIINHGKVINVWVFGLFKFGSARDFCIRTVQDVPCPTVANIFEYDPEMKGGDWKPAPINSVIIKCAE